MWTIPARIQNPLRSLAWSLLPQLPPGECGREPQTPQFPNYLESVTSFLHFGIANYPLPPMYGAAAEPMLSAEQSQ